jgi:uncharacterized membrane protein YeiH
MLTAISGGRAGDVLLAEIPTVLRPDLYAVAALVGAAIMVIANMLQLPSGVAAFVGATFCFGPASWRLGTAGGFRLPERTGDLPKA